MCNIELTPGQCQAIERVMTWYNKHQYRKHNPFIIAGYAGTGKTTLVKHIVELLGIHDVAYCTYTGKAAEALMLRGCPGQTIHSVFYKLVGDDNYGKPVFELRELLAIDYKLIIIDEISMVPDYMLKDILSFGIPIIALGDPMQLPPVVGNTCLDKYDTFLTEIQRQSANDPIIKLATMARRGDTIPYGTHGDYVHVVYRGEIELKYMLKYEQIICRYNKQRVDLNNRARYILGFEDELPMEGDKLLCLKNSKLIFPDSGYPMVNGTLGLITSKVFHAPHSENFKFSTSPTSGEVLVEADREPFTTGALGNDIFSEQLTYGYVITYHKSQGSEFESVVLFDDGPSMYDTPENQNYNKLLYTGITRARKKLLIVR